MLKTAGGIIIPGDSNTEELRKELSSLIKDPREREFERLKAEGLDSETAAELSGLHTLPADRQMEIRLKTAAHFPMHEPVAEAWNSAAYEVPRAARNVGGAAGAAVGTVVANSVLATAVKHGEAFGIIVGTAITVGVSMATARFVHKALGFHWAVAAVLNIVSMASIVGTAWIKGAKKP